LKAERKVKGERLKGMAAPEERHVYRKKAPPKTTFNFDQRRDILKKLQRSDINKEKG
jgi:hypothetical protein